MKRSRLRSKRATPRRRESPRWSPADWGAAEAVFQARSAGRCECCGDALGLLTERHHRQRRRDGGDRLCNVMILNRTCHAYWTEHPAEAKTRGIIVPPWADPADVPVLHGGQRWAMLDDDGALIGIGLDAGYGLVP